MKKLFKNITKHPIISSVIAGIITTIIGAIFTPTNILAGAKVFFLWLKTVIVAVLTFKIALGWILLGLICLVLVLILIIQIAVQNKSKPATFDDAYTTDIIDGVRWVWDWFRDYGGKYDLAHNSPHPLCPHCQSDLVYTNENYYRNGLSKLYCEHCGFKKEFRSNFDEYRDKIKREIFRNVRTGEWEVKIIEKAGSK